MFIEEVDATNRLIIILSLNTESSLQDAEISITMSCYYFLQDEKKEDVVIISGHASGADALIAFWDGKSRGTKNMIDTATKRGLKVAVVRY